MEYPKFLHNPDGRAVKVASDEEAVALGPGWYAHPNLFPKADLSDVVIDAPKAKAKEKK